MSTLPQSRTRTHLDASVTTHIDKSLKSLKRCSKRLAASCELFSSEYALLERMYYKGKNQHRAAIFWKRVVEVRRYAARLNLLGFSGLLNAYQNSFFDPAAGENSKLLKGAWTHYPSSDTVKNSQKALTNVIQLTAKMQERTENAYRVLTEAMRTGAFLQFVLLLTAITSRMSMLASELHDTASEVLEIVSQSGFLLYGFPVSKSTSDIRPTFNSQPIPSLLENELETGTVVERPKVITSAAKPPSITEVDMYPAFQQPSIVEREVVSRPKKSLASRPNKEKKSSNQKKRDAIDDIFGF